MTLTDPVRGDESNRESFPPHRGRPRPRTLMTTWSIGGPLLALFGLASLATADDAIRVVFALGALVCGTASGVLAVIWLVENRRH